MGRIASVASFAAVLDACVLFPMTLRDTLLRAADAGLYRPYWTDDILEEVRRNLVEERHVTAEQAERLIAQMKRYFPESLITHHTALIPDMTNHPKDRHVLAAAVAAGAQIIVTDNLRDFPHAALDPLGVEAQSADTFLTDLFALDSERMARIVEEQAQDRHKPPKTTLQVLAILAKHAPTFAALVHPQPQST
jgi:predicted nucleic acid-binding protein